MKVFVYGVLAVGMRHYGSSQLIVGDVYYLHRDRNNPHDENAVAIVDRSGRKKASLKRDAAAMVAALFDDDLIRIRRNQIFLKPKARGEFHSRRIGTAQRCNAGFLCEERDKDIITQHLSQYHFRFRFE